MNKKSSLEEYRQKRNFKQTSEPYGEGQKPGEKARREPIFVVQKHAASTLHYDFRLEIGGVLASWAVPKGPSLDPQEKRLAMRTEDHPMEYAGFEGEIPAGEYGAGTVIVWDKGTFRNLGEKDGREVPLEKALENGHLTFWLNGKKLQGGFALTKFGEGQRWLLVKMKDEKAAPEKDLVTAEPQSVLSGRIIPETGNEAVKRTRRRSAGRTSERKETPTRTKSMETRSRRQAGPSREIKVGSHIIELSSTNRVLFPEDGITKGDLIEYYRRIAEIMVPYLRDRPLVMNRYPEGIEGEGFVQQEISDYFPDWIERLAVKKEGGYTTHVLCQNPAILVYLANQSCITLHTWLSRKGHLTTPDQLIFDLDPPGNDFAAVREAAILLRKFLQEIDLEPWVKTTGSRGLHVVLPLDGQASFDQVRSLAQDVAKELAQREPEKLTVEQRKEKRRGRVFVDVGRNSYGQTAVAPYSVRARPGAPVSTPLDWEDLSELKQGSQSYKLKNIFERLARKKEPWEGMRRRAYSLEKTQKKLDSLR